MKIHLQTDRLRAVLDSQGAELVSLQNSEGKELLWSGGPEWPRHAPVLFPIIGRMAGNVLLHEGQEYPIKQHGFARDSEFTVLTSSPNAARLRLEASPETEGRFPFAFSLDAVWTLNGPHLKVTFILTNTGKSHMPVSLGWHPAFHWDAREGWELIFAKEEPDRIRRVNSNVQLTTAKDPSPVLGRSLHLTEDQFDQGAMIFETVRSREVRYSSPEGPVLDMAFPGYDQFTVWKQPGADFVCLEPWSGMPAPAAFRGEILHRPAQTLLSPAEERRFTCQLTVHRAPY